MAKSPNVYSTNYVNSGPGVGMTSSSRSGIEGSSKSIESFSKNAAYGKEISSKAIELARSFANAIKTNPGFEQVREGIRNPSSSAIAASLYDDFDSEFGLSYDMDEYYDRLLDLTNTNNEWSASQAQKQMDFQSLSNKAAMAWSAGEAMKSREWTESLSNTAHQREVKDLVAAGLNPILSANNGAYSGSGATGQAFSSNGAMGQTDTNASSAIASMMSGVLSTARDLAVTRMTTNTQRYMSDQNYAAAKLAAGASIYNNNNSVSAQKAISQLNRDADIQKANISADATRSAAATSAGAMMSAAETNAAAARYNADQHAEAQKFGSEQSRAASEYGSRKQLEGKMYEVDRNFKTNPVGYAAEFAKEAADAMSGYDNVYSPDLGNWDYNSLGSE